VEIFDSCTEILREIEKHTRKKGARCQDRKLIKFRKHIMAIKALARNVYLYFLVRYNIRLGSFEHMPELIKEVERLKRNADALIREREAANKAKINIL
jgi:hypothetical protein